MKSHLVVVFVVIFFVPLVAVAETPSPKVTVIAPPSLHHVPSVQRVTRALRHAVTDLAVGDRAVPNVVLICADRQTADVMMLASDADLSIVKMTLRDPDRQVYRVTIVEDTSDRALAVAMVWFVNSHFQLGWSAPRLMKLAAHIRDDLQKTVETRDLAAKR